MLGAWTADDSGAGDGAWVAITLAVVLSAIFLLSLLPKYGKRGRGAMDYFIAGAALVVLALWKFGDFSPAAATSLGILGDSWFSWLTIREAWRQPQTEALGPWIAGTSACALGVAAL